MSEQSATEEARKRAQEIYERLQRERRWDFHNTPPSAPPSGPPPPPAEPHAPA